MIKRITDDNYQQFKQADRAAIVVSTSSCGYCKQYKPTLEALSNLMPYIEFGEIILDQGRVIQPKREYKDIVKWTLPTTLLMKNGKEVHRISGYCLYPAALKAITDNLIVGGQVYFSQNGKNIPAKITHLAGEIYVLNVNGKKIETTKDNIKWTLEERL